MSSIEFTQFKSILKENSHFITMPRMRLFGVLQNHPALTFKELLSLTSKHDRSTLYRNVDLFEKLGIITRIRLGWHTKIELTDRFTHHHHHHLTCIKCGKVSVLKDSESIEKEIDSMSRNDGFKPTDHQLEITGVCMECQTIQ